MVVTVQSVFRCIFLVLITNRPTTRKTTKKRKTKTATTKHKTKTVRQWGDGSACKRQGSRERGDLLYRMYVLYVRTVRTAREEYARSNSLITRHRNGTRNGSKTTHTNSRPVTFTPTKITIQQACTVVFSQSEQTIRIYTKKI